MRRATKFSIAPALMFTLLPLASALGQRAADVRREPPPMIGNGPSRLPAHPSRPQPGQPAAGVPTRTATTGGMRGIKLAIPSARGGMMDTAVVESGEVRFLIEPLLPQWRYSLKGAAGYFSWRVDATDGPGFAMVLASDSLLRTTNVVKMVEASSLRRCENPRLASARSCTLPMKDEPQVRWDHIQFVLKDSAIVQYFRTIRPAQMYATTFEPGGRFRVDAIPIAYHDGVKAARNAPVVLPPK